MSFACADIVRTIRLFLFYENIVENKKHRKRTIGYLLTH